MLTIVWDVDDVLNDLMKSWFELKWLPEHQTGLSVQYAELVQNPPHELLGISLDEYLQSLDAFRQSEQGRQLVPCAEIVAWFQKNGHLYRHVALTATPISCATHSAAWVFRHFGTWIRSFAFVPSKRDTDPEFSYDKTKKEYLQWWGKTDIVVDDNPEHTAAAEKLGLKAYLVQRPWNKSERNLTTILDELSHHS